MRRLAYKAIMISLAAALPLTASAGNGKEGGKGFPRFTFGVESSYMLTFLTRSHYNFISGEGDRRDERSLTVSAFSNGEFLVHGGVNVSDKVNLSVYTGYSGVYLHERMIPLSLRATWLSGNDPSRNRWLIFCSAGTGFNDLQNPGRLSAEGRLGGGFRLSLNRSVKMDLLLSFREVYTHPKAYETDIGNYVPQERLRRNDAYISSFTFGIAIVF